MPAQKGLKAVAKMLGGRGAQLKFAKAAGAAANANITVTGIKARDQIVGILWFEDLAVASGDVFKGDLTAELKAGYPVDNTIQLTTSNTTGDTLVVVYLAKRG